MLKEFKAFILRGNVVDLAVGVVIGAAFGAIINSLVNDVVTPLISQLNVPDFSRAFIDFDNNGELSSGDVRYGAAINAVISFILIGAVVFFFVVKPMNHLMARGDKEEEPARKECSYCLSSIPAEARVCAHCTREVGAA